MSNALRQRADKTIPANRIRYEFQAGIHCWIYLLSLEVSTIGLFKSQTRFKTATNLKSCPQIS